ncbi:hypothetical protein LAZ67_15001804 [Cordylochernes scorpioides]|uniref:Reverse transcriptase domain-containing protein n=1 Tax=Cordylochernes scorpioides TaxID=51811 RepID=A0ABY6L920_9ARAC|nr:hypothetical protein LAZ67_15001804 [Cordylochernes scorpioides]
MNLTIILFLFITCQVKLRACLFLDYANLDFIDDNDANFDKVADLDQVKNIHLARYVRYGKSNLRIIILSLLLISGIESNPGPKATRQTTLETFMEKDLRELIAALSIKIDNWGSKKESRLSSIELGMQKFDSRVQQLESSLEDTACAVASNAKKISEFERQVEFLEIKNREKNLVFYGIEGNSYQISSKIKFEIKDKKVEKKARKIIHDCKNFTSTHNIFHEKINMKELDYALENTDLNKTPGPDGIHGQMISNLGKNGKEILLDIFNNSWKTGKLPQDWKTATIIPIKKLDKSADDPKNYRPISLTSICCKLMEKIILRRLTYHLDTRNLLPEEQYGFRKGHGTIDQLLFFTQKVKDAQNRKPTNNTLAAFLDLTQTFDKEYGKTS